MTKLEELERATLKMEKAILSFGGVFALMGESSTDGIRACRDALSGPERELSRALEDLQIAVKQIKGGDNN